MAFKPGSFDYASAYAQRFGDDLQPIAPGRDLSSGGVSAMADAAAGNFETASSFASAGLEGLAARKKSDVLAKSFLDQARLANQQSSARNRSNTLGGIGKLIGGVVGLFNPVAGAVVSGASGFLG